MLIFATQLQKCNVQAVDGEVGKIKDIYFDEDDWVARYFVVDTLKWLPGKKVLLSPVALDHLDMENETLKVVETKDNIKNSPWANEGQPVTRQQEMLQNTHFGWPHYWGYPSAHSPWGGYPTPVELRDAEYLEAEMTPEQKEAMKLHSVDEIKGDIMGFDIIGKDGKVGKVNNFILDATNWKLRYFVVQKRTIMPDKYIAVGVDWIENISWEDRTINVALPNVVIEEGPFFEFDTPFTEEDEKKLHEHYQNRPKN